MTDWLQLIDIRLGSCCTGHVRYCVYNVITFHLLFLCDLYKRIHGYRQLSITLFKK
jgi:hypothetical protein